MFLPKKCDPWTTFFGTRSAHRYSPTCFCWGVQGADCVGGGGAGGAGTLKLFNGWPCSRFPMELPMEPLLEPDEELHSWTGAKLAALLGRLVLLTGIGSAIAVAGGSCCDDNTPLLLATEYFHYTRLLRIKVLRFRYHKPSHYCIPISDS